MTYRSEKKTVARRFRFGIAAALIVSLMVAAGAVAEIVAPPPALESLQAYFRDQVEQERVTSITLAVRKGGALIWAEAFGYRDFAEKIPATPETLYPIASLSKPVTGALMLLLQDQGLLQLDDAANEYLGVTLIDGNGYDADQVTLLSLANHVSGLPPEIDMVYDDAPIRSFAERMQRFGWLANKPGDFFIYNNLSTEILSQVAQKVAGRTWHEQLRTGIFEPLGMRQTARWAAGIDDPEKVKLYCRSFEGDFVQVGAYELNSFEAGGIWSTPVEYARFTDMVIAGGELDGVRVLSPESATAMLAPENSGGGRSARGVAWKSDTFRGHQRISHVGGMPGIKSAAHGIPDGRIVVVLAVNCDQDSLRWSYTQKILDAVVPETAPRPTAPTAPAGNGDAGPPLNLEELAGTWSGQVQGPDAVRNITLELAADGALDIALDGVPATRQHALTKPGSKFMGGSTALGRQLAFDLNAELPLHATYRGGLTIQFQLNYKDGVLDGAAIASPIDYAAQLTRDQAPVKRPQFQIPMRTRLTRVTGDAASGA